MQFANKLVRTGKGFLLLGILVALLAACGGGGGGGGGPIGDPNPNPPDVPGDDNGNDDDGNDDGNDDDNTDDPTPAFVTFQAASLVVGQQDFTVGEPDQGGTAPGANTLDMPAGGVAYSSESDVMFITDSGNSRVLGYLGLPDTNNVNADFVLGQADFTLSDQAVSASGMISPEQVTVSGGRLMVTDTDLNRVAVYDGIPTAGGATPVFVVGQPTMDAYVAACDQSTLLHPHAHFLTPDGKLIVADAANNRVLVWNTMPTENGAPADFVLGQLGFENCSNAEPENFQHPASIWSDGEQLIVADSEKHRVLIWNTFPTTSFQPPDVILGQTVMTNISPNDDDQDGATDASGTPTARTLSYPRDLEVVDGKLYVADMDNHRVLIWNSVPTESFAPADVVLGQPDFTSNAPNAGEAEPNDHGFQRPIGVSVIGEQLFVTDWENSRVVVFDKQVPAE